MAAVFEKLQLEDQKEIVALNAPQSFEPELARLKGCHNPPGTEGSAGEG